MPPAPSPPRRGGALRASLLASSVMLVAGFFTGAWIASITARADADASVVPAVAPYSLESDADSADTPARLRRRARIRADRLAQAAAAEPPEAGAAPTRGSEQARIDAIDPRDWLAGYGPVVERRVDLPRPSGQ